MLPHAAIASSVLLSFYMGVHMIIVYHVDVGICVFIILTGLQPVEVGWIFCCFTLYESYRVCHSCTCIEMVLPMGKFSVITPVFLLLLWTVSLVSGQTGKF